MHQVGTMRHERRSCRGYAARLIAVLWTLPMMSCSSSRPGAERPRPMHRRKSDLDLYREHNFVLEAFDSSYWRMVSRRLEVIEALEKVYTDTRRCPPW
jgi:hypothetical protein